MGSISARNRKWPTRSRSCTPPTSRPVSRPSTAPATSPRSSTISKRPTQNSITLSSGDNFIPSPFFSAGSDASLKEVYETALETYYGLAPGTLNISPGFGTADISMLDIIGVQASAIGNHEFDAGTKAFADIIKQTATFPGAQFPYLAANLDFSADANLAGVYTSAIQNGGNYTGFPPAAGNGKKIAPATILEEGGEKIGVVGVTTQIVESISSTGGVEVIGDDVDDMAALAAIIQPTIDALLAQGIDKIIVVSHLQQLAWRRRWRRCCTAST